MRVRCRRTATGGSSRGGVRLRVRMMRSGSGMPVVQSAPESASSVMISSPLSISLFAAFTDFCVAAVGKGKCKRSLCPRGGFLLEFLHQALQSLRKARAIADESYLHAVFLNARELLAHFLKRLFKYAEQVGDLGLCPTPILGRKRIKNVVRCAPLFLSARYSSSRSKSTFLPASCPAALDTLRAFGPAAIPVHDYPD